MSTRMSEELFPASPPKQTGRLPFRMRKLCIVKDIRSKICSEGSKTGGASTPATTDARTPSWPLSALQPL